MSQFCPEFILKGCEFLDSLLILPSMLEDNLPPVMKALVTTGKGGVEIHTVELPTFGDADVLIKVHSVAQNPTDCKYIHKINSLTRDISWAGKTVALRREEGNIIGCDFSGVVVKMGREVPSELRFIGERVAGIVHGGNRLLTGIVLYSLTRYLGIGRNGAFSQYVSVPAALLFSLPDSWSFEQGAQLGVACFTACQCLYQYLHLPTPFGISESVPREFILVWSGATSTGQYVIQLARLSGLRIITTSSPRNFDLLKSLGAELVFDYADSYTFKHILAATQGRLTMAIDCHCAGTSLMQVPRSFGESGGSLAALLPIKSRIPNVKTEFILAYSIFGLVRWHFFPILFVLKMCFNLTGN